MPFLSETTTKTKSNYFLRTTLATTTRKLAIVSSSSSTVVSAANNVYGRGADIWPESNNDVIKISDSFPNGIVPDSAFIPIEQIDEESIQKQVQSFPATKSSSFDLKNGRSITSTIPNQRAIGSISKIPIAIALALLVTGMVRPMDVALVASLTAYITILNMTAQSERDGGAPILPSVPPQGHIPKILSNPLGMRFERSSTYRRWLRLGALVGMIGPLAWLLVTTVVLPWQGAVVMEPEAARVVSRPLFLMCCQVTTEAISKRNLMPLPLRVLVPIVYNASRLAYLWQWAFANSNLYLGGIGRCLGILNAAYWSINLFAFLIPIASIRYMRAHFFGVEAERVTTRFGLEETIGIVPNNI